MDSHPAQLELIARLSRRCREYEDRIAELEEEKEARAA